MDDETKLHELKKQIAETVLYFSTKHGYSNIKQENQSLLDEGTSSFKDLLIVADKVVKDTSKGKTTKAISKTLKDEQKVNDSFKTGADSIKGWF